jgi:hypothetical protein
VVVPVLRGEAGAAWKELSDDVRPRLSLCLYGLKELDILLIGPLAPVDRWVEGIVPALSALTTVPRLHTGSDKRPLCAKLFYGGAEAVVLLC